ncbi:CAP domain-containing protein [Streptomyces sp. TRM66268-LWL]|uniref:CAP domain-containing protein n=1 Tax=Streptomyces polyasparticus TaxID=2767826 RepID=A0ABR7SBA6_9ACTN|nr:CAP domain-containing protein [Streptomyces polyasparticus]MBC9711628.1 CAP domain-containing protein [Streptomyces polyasparticus]
MGRHRRVAADTQQPTATTGTGGSHRRRKRAAAKPVRTGLLGVSAAVALGAVAVASGVLPGTENYRFGNEPTDKVQAADVSGDVQSQGGSSKTPERQASEASRDEERQAPSASPSKSTEKPSPTPSRTAEEDAKDETGGGNKTEKPAEEKTRAPEKSAAPDTPDTQSGAEAQVLALVNQERAQAGCQPVEADPQLAELASDFSADMAARGFFDHTDPEGDTPWDRADAVGIANLGGENIARGQANAQSVMDSWMDSPGHRANILNCEYETLGVGAHFGAGGPWWTQDFGF